jgi:oxygen-independent coproporphyrinogen III oxidase
MSSRPDAAEPLAIYVHIPFCVRKCHYCDFNAGPASQEIRAQYVDALVAEIRRSPWRGRAGRTLFFGGGTPSELTTDQLRIIVSALRESFTWESHHGGNGTRERQSEGETEGADHPSTPQHSTLNTQSSTPRIPEWTIECNPGTVAHASLREMRAMGFNRISLGVQSFHDHHLKALGRIHTAAEAVEAVAAAREAGFGRLNLDLIFCLPGQTLAEWKSDVERALELQPDHLSLYNLTIEDKTEFGRRHRAGLLSLPDEDLSADMYEWAIDRMAAAGFEQYEVSNFALRGEECRHNQVYWRSEPFIGFGVSAASYYEGLRWTNTGSMQCYLETSGQEGGPERAGEERLLPLAAAGEAIMLGLRTREGADLAEIAERHRVDTEAVFGGAARRLEGDRLLRREGPRLKLTRRGIMLANAVCEEFLQ